MEIKQKQIKEWIRNGQAVDVTLWDDKRLYKLINTAINNGLTVDRPYYSTGVYGCNGAVMTVNGKKYATTSRCCNMYILLRG